MYELVLRTFGMAGQVEENCKDPRAAYSDYFASLLIAQQLDIPPLIKFGEEEVKRMRPKVPEGLLAELEANSRRLVNGLALKR